MQEFKTGQTVCVVDNDHARNYSLDQMIGRTFVVGELSVCEVTGSIDAVTPSGLYVPPEACELVAEPTPTTFQAVAAMNEAFGNPKGDPRFVNWDKIRSQFKNVFDEYCEGLVALGYSPFTVDNLRTAHAEFIGLRTAAYEEKPEDFRDAVADIKVFCDGASHLAGYDGDADMHLVVDAVMTRFIKDAADKEATQALHAAKGVTDVYFEGDYPTMVMKSASDQPDAPKGKFLKSASYSQPVFPEA